MRKWALMTGGIVIVLIIAGVLFFFKYFSYDSPETSLNIEGKGYRIYATKNIEEKTAELVLRMVVDSVTIDTDSIEFKNSAIVVCSHMQGYYYNKTYRQKILADFELSGAEKEENNIRLEVFLQEYTYDLEMVKMENVYPNGKRFFDCVISGPNKEDNLISLYAEDGSIFSFALDD